MRKIAIAISLLLTISLVTPMASASSAKAGDRCKKVGRTVTAGGQELVCKKKGARNVWTAVAKKQPTPTTSATQEPTTKSYTKAEVAAKNSASNCWTIVGDKVYDLTQWISRHPGGSGAIASLCGIDGTSRFKSQHGSSGRPNSILDGYYIGDLKS
jgi:cytochrome b involved in lipid metabolism